MTILSNIEVAKGALIFERADYPEAKLMIKNGVPIKKGDLLQINNRYNTASSIEVITSDDGYTVNATDDFKDDNATFQTSGVAIGDILWIQENTHEGYYRIWKIDSETQVSVCKELFISDVDGYTTISTDDFKDDTTNAFADVAVGDIVYIEEGSDAGWYVVGTKDSNNQLSLTGLTATASESNLTYSIYKKVSFTSTTSLDYEIWIATIFKGRITDKNFEKVKTILAESEAEEIDKPIETEFYCGRLGGLIQELLDNECAFINHSFTQSSPYNYRAPHNFRNEPNGTWNGDYFFNYIVTSGTGTVEVISSLGDHKKVLELDCGTGYAQVSVYKFGDWSLDRYYDVMEVYFRFAQTNEAWLLRVDDDDGSGGGGVTPYSGVYLKFDSDGNIKYLDGIYGDSTWVTIQSYAADTWYKIKIKYDVNNEDGLGDCTHKWDLWIDDTKKSGTGWDFYGVDATYDDMQNKQMKTLHLLTSSEAGGIAYIDAFGSEFNQDYIAGVNATKEYDDLIYTTEFKKYPMTEKTIRLYLNSYCDKHLKVWYLTPTYEILFNDGDVDSGIDIGSTSNYKNVDGKKQVKAVDKVILKGGIVNGERLFASYGTGNVIAKDTYAHILDATDLTDMAQQVYSRQSAGILKVALDYQELLYGYIQIGEEMTIKGNQVRFKKSDDYICTSDTQFKLRAERLELGTDGVIAYSELYLDDVLVFERSTEDDLEKADQENSQLISEVSGETITGGGGGGGTTETMANVGAGGVGVYKQKLGLEFQMRTINAGSAKITITQDDTNDEVDIDLAETYLKDLVDDLSPELGGQLDCKDKAITSDSADTVFYFGTCKIGGTSGNLLIANRTYGGMGLTLNTSGAVIVNAASGQNVTLSENLSTKLDVNASGVRFGGTGARITEIEDNDALGTSDVKLCTQGNVKAYTDLLKQKGSSFPGSPIDGDLYYDLPDEALYRYSSDAQAWIQIGASGAGDSGAMTLQQVADNARIINNANSSANAVQIGDSGGQLKIWRESSIIHIEPPGGNEIAGIHKYAGQTYVNATGGFTLSGTYYEIALSDSDADIYYRLIVPETRTTWQLTFITSISGVTPPSACSGTLSVGASGSGETIQTTNIFNAINFDETYLYTGRYYFNVTSTFSASAGDVLYINYHKDANDGTGNLQVYGFYLTFVS